MKNKIIIMMMFLSPLFSGAQNILAYRSVSELQQPELTWFTLDKALTLNFDTYRAPLGSEDFARVPVVGRTTSNGDTLFYHIIDTLLPEMGIYRYYVLVEGGHGESYYSEIMFGHNMGSLPSPRVVSFSARSATDRKSIELEWKLNYSFTVKSLVLFRSRNHESGFQMVAILPAGDTSYSDIVQISNEPYFYFLQIRDFFGYQLPSVVIHGICTYAEKPYPPQDFDLLAKDGAVRLNWRKVGENIIGYRVYRNYTEPGNFIQMGQMIPADGDTCSFLDTAVNMPGSSKASYYVVTVSDGYLESNPGDTLSVQLPWNIIVFPPEEIDYVVDSSGYLRLFWSVPVGSTGILGYNIYRDWNGSGLLQINEATIPVIENTFLDKGMMGFGNCRYAIESVSVSGKVSDNRSVIDAQRPIESFHLVITARLSENNVELTWIDPVLPGLEKLFFYRNLAGEAAELRGSAIASKQLWIDKGVAPGGNYIYSVVAEFRDGTRILVNDGFLVAKF